MLSTRDYPSLRAWRRIRPPDWKDTCHRDPLWHAAVLELQAREWDSDARRMQREAPYSAEVCRRQADRYMQQAAELLARAAEESSDAA